MIQLCFQSNINIKININNVFLFIMVVLKNVLWSDGQFPSKTVCIIISIITIIPDCISGTKQNIEHIIFYQSQYASVGYKGDFPI